MGVSPGLLEVGLECERRIPQEELLGRREAGIKYNCTLLSCGREWGSPPEKGGAEEKEG